MGTLDHQIKLTTAQVSFLFLASSRQLYLFKHEISIVRRCHGCRSLRCKQELEAKQEDAATPAFFTGDLLIQQQAIDAIAAADAKLGLIEGKLSAFAGETATLKAAVDAYEAVVNTEGYGPTVQLFTPNV